MATEEKIGHMTDNKKQVQEAKERVYHTAQTTKDGTTETTNQTGSTFLFGKTGAANDRVLAVAQSAKESAQAGRDKTTAVLEKTAVKVKGVAAGTTDTVKQTLGTKSMYTNLSISHF